jgi:hypothetical protein
VPDRHGQGKDALQDPYGDAGDRAAAVVFEVELAFLKVWLTDSMLCRTARSRPRPGRSGSVRYARVG